MSLSTHVLDAVTGQPAVGIAVVAERAAGVGWTALGGGTTDADGRVRDLAPQLRRGPHRLVFATGDWFAAAGTPAFWPEVVLVFTVEDPDRHHHVPLLLSPYAYSTYRGS